MCQISFLKSRMPPNPAGGRASDSARIWWTFLFFFTKFKEIYRNFTDRHGLHSYSSAREWHQSTDNQGSNNYQLFCRFYHWWSIEWKSVFTTSLCKRVQEISHLVSYLNTISVVPLALSFDGQLVKVRFRRPLAATGTNKDLRNCQYWAVSSTQVKSSSHNFLTIKNKF